MSQSILYYPNIDMKDGVWLRNALLYWDEVCSIVPNEYYDGLSPEVCYMQERGFYRAIYPKDIFYNGDFEEFKTSIEKRLKYRCKQIANHRVRLNRQNRQIYSQIHCSKMPYEIMNLFEDAERNSSEWITIKNDIAEIYMRTLAEFAAKYDEEDIVVGTDSLMSLDKIYKRIPCKDENVATSLIINKCLPLPSMDTPFEEIIDFKERRRSELFELRIKIRDLEQKISQSESVEEIKSRIAEFKEEWIIELERASKLFKGDGIGFALGSLRSFIADAGAMAGLTQGIKEYLEKNKVPVNLFGTIIGTAGLVGVGVNYMKYRGKTNVKHPNGSFAYILNAYRNNLLNGKIYELI